MGMLLGGSTYVCLRVFKKKDFVSVFKEKT
jgi:hypothetical protein